MNFSEIIKEYSYKTELHAHTNPVSKCGKFSADEVVRIYIEEGCNTLTITNHLQCTFINDHISSPVESYLSDYYIAKKTAESSDMNVALGVEIRFPESANDYLVYGVCANDIEKLVHYAATDIETFYKEFKNDKNLILQAHPFRSNMTLAPLDAIDGIESLNLHPGHNSRIANATKYAKENGLIVSGGSDFHEKDRQATCLLRTKQEIKDSYDIVEALKSKDVVFDISGHIVIPYLY